MPKCKVRFGRKEEKKKKPTSVKFDRHGRSDLMLISDSTFWLSFLSHINFFFFLICFFWVSLLSYPSHLRFSKTRRKRSRIKWFKCLPFFIFDRNWSRIYVVTLGICADISQSFFTHFVQTVKTIFPLDCCYQTRKFFM